ncbi:MAG: hypothetical protein PVH64_10665 [Bacillota bacterium]|jgi:hypothetical protein
MEQNVPFFRNLLEKIHPKFLRLQYPLAVAGWILLVGLIYTTVTDVGKFIKI